MVLIMKSSAMIAFYVASLLTLSHALQLQLASVVSYESVVSMYIYSCMYIVTSSSRAVFIYIYALCSYFAMETAPPLTPSPKIAIRSLTGRKALANYLS